MYFHSPQRFIQLQLKLFFFNTNIHSTSTQTIFLQHKYSFNFNSNYFHSTQKYPFNFNSNHSSSTQIFTHNFCRPAFLKHHSVGKPFVASLKVACFFRPIFTSPVGNSCILRTIISSWLLQ